MAICILYDWKNRGAGKTGYKQKLSRQNKIILTPARHTALG